VAVASAVEGVQSPTIAAARLPAVDILRGLAIVVMALDHVRDFTSNIPFEPEDLAHTFPALFLTRWVTHFCAPVFFFLAGTGAYLLYTRTRSTGHVQHFLLTRGVWLVFVELTVVWFAWTFLFPGHLAGVLWALGWSMVLLAALIRISTRWIAAIALTVIAGHDLLDAINPHAFGSFTWLWAILHVRMLVIVPGLNWPMFVLFPIVPLAAVMAAGYAFGNILTMERKRRIALTATIGAVATLLFIVLRGFNLYGNPGAGIAVSSPGPWHPQATLAMTAVSFLDVEKYPPSLQFLLMTLGPALLLLALLDRLISSARVPVYLQPLHVFGRVPFFFYVMHLFTIHLAAIAVYAALHEPTGWLLHGGFFAAQRPAGTGIALPQVWLLWLAVVVMLYFPCAAFAKLKARSRDWRLRYL
jgi:uncharacterized membrane protein